MLRTLPSLLMLPVLAIAAPIPKDKVAPLYYPTKVGDTLVYETTFGESVVEEVMVVIKVEPTAAGMLVTTGRQNRDEVTPISRVEVTPNGLMRTWYANMDLKPPAQLLKLPATPGDTWTVKSTAKFPARTSEYTTVKTEDVEVPAGKFKAIRVEMESKSGREKTTATYWYAPDLGLVKMTSKSGNLEGIMVLKSFTPGK